MARELSVPVGGPVCVIAWTMSLADGCLVRISEVLSRGTIFTLEGDFRPYRRHGRKHVTWPLCEHGLKRQGHRLRKTPGELARGTATG
mgnify:CR=1 FL=1